MISTGTERLVASGLVDAGFQKHMNVPYQSGSFDLPIKYGYSLIVEGEDGKLGHIMHPHQNKIDVDANKIFWIDEDMSAPRFSLISNVETVINAIWDSAPSQKDSVGICGFGNLGSLLANTLRTHLGIEAVIIEQSQWHKQKAESLGWKLHNEDSYDIIFHTSATEKGLQFCVDHLNFEGKLVELSWYGNRKVNLSLGKNFHYNRLKIISSQVSKIPNHMKDRYNYATRRNLALQILKDDSFDALITNKIPFDKSPKFFEDLRKGKIEDGLIYVIEY
jgi:D-arabinose 1-dehydrogenase-like Zn-dependent alcohol dehydrogenase